MSVYMCEVWIYPNAVASSIRRASESHPGPSGRTMYIHIYTRIYTYIYINIYMYAYPYVYIYVYL